MVGIALALLVLGAQDKNPFDEFTPVPDNEWVTVATTPTGGAWMLRAKDWASSDTGKSVWVKIDASRDRTVKWRSAMHEYSISCRERSMQDTAIIIYDASGNVLASSQTGYRAGANRGVVPDSIGEQLVDAVCKK